jgi:hypothetical protein
MYLIYANLYSEFLSMNHRDLHDINFIIFHTLNLLNSLRGFQEIYTHTMAPKGIQCVFLTVAIGNCMVKIVPPVNFCFDENIQINFGTKLEYFLN